MVAKKRRHLPSNSNLRKNSTRIIFSPGQIFPTSFQEHDKRMKRYDALKEYIRLSEYIKNNDWKALTHALEGDLIRCQSVISDKGETLLHALSYKQDIPQHIIDMVFSNNEINVNQQDKFNQTALHIITQKPSSLPLAQCILTRASDQTLFIEDNKHENVFMSATRYNQINMMKLFLEYHVKNTGNNQNAHKLINRKSIETLKTALHIACEVGNMEIVEFLITNNANINDLDKQSLTPLFYAIIRSQNVVVDYLVRHPSTLLTTVCLKKLNVLHYAAGKESCEILQILHQMHESTWRKLLCGKSYEQTTPIFSAVRFNRVQNLKFLILHGANLTSRDYKGETILFEAVRKQNIEAIKAILSRAPADIINLQNRNDQTALHLIPSSSPIYQLLVQKGANIHLIHSTLHSTHTITTTATRETNNISGRISPSGGRGKTTREAAGLIVTSHQEVKRQKLVSSSSSETTSTVSVISEFGCKVINYEHITLLEKIGEGAFGSVWSANWVTTRVAIKFFKSEDRGEMLKREVAILDKLNHPNVMKCFGVCQTDSSGTQYGLVLEYMPLTLSNVIVEQPLTLTQILTIAKGISSGMAFLHEQNIIHRDLKPSNILLDHNFQPKIADFGISRAESVGSAMTKIGTPYYMAPEMLVGLYDQRVDVFSFAMVFLQMFTRASLYHDMSNCNPMNVAYNVVHNQLRPQIPSFVPSIISSLIKSCWQTDPNERSSFLLISKTIEEIQDKCANEPQNMPPILSNSSNADDCSTTIPADQL